MASKTPGAEPAPGLLVDRRPGREIGRQQPPRARRRAPSAAIPKLGREAAADDLLDAAGDAAEAAAEIASFRREAAAATVRAAALAVQQAEADLAFGRLHPFPGGAIRDIERLGGAAERAVSVDRLEQLDAPLGEDHVSPRRSIQILERISNGATLRSEPPCITLVLATAHGFVEKDGITAIFADTSARLSRVTP